MRATRIECRTSTVMVKLWKLSLNCRGEKLPAFRPTQVTGRLTTLPGGERVGPGPAARSPGQDTALRSGSRGLKGTGSIAQAQAHRLALWHSEGACVSVVHQHLPSAPSRPGSYTCASSGVPPEGHLVRCLQEDLLARAPRTATVISHKPETKKTRVKVPSGSKRSSLQPAEL